jgi:acyl-CoA reductase-like NAD-dependent aldehyde dehydrogenase
VRGKAINAGQTCVAPDTVLLAGVDATAFKTAMAAAWAALYPDGLVTGLAGEQELERLEQLCRNDRLLPLGPARDGLRPPLSLVLEPEAGSPLLQAELFGPVLPVLSFDRLEPALEWVREHPAPLAVYLFSGDRAVERRVLDRTRAGALVVGDTLIQAAMVPVPFGGVGASGFGRYHGRAGFDTFSNLRTHVRAARWSLSRLTSPPYGPRAQRLAELLLQR